MQSLASLKGFIDPPFFEVEFNSPYPFLNRSKLVFDQTFEIANAGQREYVKDDEDFPLSWTRSVIRRAHTLKQPLLTLKGLVLILKPKVLKNIVNLST